ncbi:MAG: transposase [Thermoanaerobaculaceae bacterium]
MKGQGIKRGERRVWRDVKVKGNVAGYWGEGSMEPAFVFTNMDPEEGLELYRERMRIEEMFRDVKGLLGLGKVMTKGRRNPEALIELKLLNPDRHILDT